MNLQDNQIGDKGAASIAQALPFNSSLTKLDISYNEIGNEGATAIAQALKSNSVITKLTIYGNQIGLTGAKVIAQALLFNSSLTELNLDHSCMSMELCSSIEKCLGANKHNKIMRAKTLQELCCAHLSLTDVDILMNKFPSFHSFYSQL